MATEPGIDETLDLTAEAIAIFDMAANLRTANRAFREAMRPIGGFLEPGASWPVLLGEAQRKGLIGEVDAATLRMIEEQLLDRPDAHPEVTLETADGLTVTARLSPLSDDGFAMVLAPRAGGSSVAESELEELMSKVLEACPTCLTMSRIGDGRILYRSPAATVLLGKGFNTLEHFASRSERADFLTALLPSARVDDMQITAKSTEGRVFPASVSARLIDYRGEDVIVSTISDLTERLETEAEMERQEKQLFQLEKMSALGEVLSGIAHELNNPLSVVVGNAHLLLEEDIEDDLRPRVERMTGAAERCVRIVRTFLSMARDRPLELDTHSVAGIVSAARDVFEASGMADGIGLTASIDEGLPDLLVDEVQIVQVLVNILTNAAQAMVSSGRGGRIDISAVAGSDGVRFRLSDDGPGVPEEVADRIFDPLFTTKEAGEGTGLGLALCHRIVVAHGGSIMLDTTVRHGASFVLDLPAG